MSTIFRERERERDWETSSHGGRSYTTVKRYKIPERTLEEDTYESEMRVVHRPREHDVQERREVREYVVDRKDDNRDREVREYRYVERDVERDPSPRRSEIREYRIEREVERSPSPPPTTVREYRVERQVERDVNTDPYQLERYSRSTEFFRPEPTPQAIIIRNEAPQPIVLRESAPQQVIIRREEPSYELIERTKVVEEQPVVRREPRQDSDYYYERKVKEVGGRREVDYYDEREYVRGRYNDRDAYSDDDVVYIHKEKDTWGPGRDVSPHHRRHLAEGVIGGVAAAELIRHNRRKQGDDPGHHIRQTLGYGALGAVGAEAISRLRNRSRSRSWSPERGRRHRSRSSSRTKKIGTVAALAGIGALAYAAGKRGTKNQTTIIEDRRSRSRRRKSSRSRSKSVKRETSRGRSESRHMDPEHRNRRVAQVGLASAAVAGLVEHARSKSRSRKGERSRSRVRQGIPIAAAGVAGAAVSGLYERAKGKKEAKELSRSRSRSRSRSVRSVRRGSTTSDAALVEYGGDPIYTDRASSRRSRDYDPADHRHRRRGSSSSSDGGRRRSRSSRSRSKSRTRKAAETAAVAGVAGLAAHEAAKRREKKKAERERQRQEDSAYSTGSYSPGPPGADDPQYFPQTNYFPPPPTQPVDYNNNYPPYNPADYPPSNGGHIPPPPGGYSPPLEPGNPYAQQDPRYRRPDDNVSALPEHMQARPRSFGGPRLSPAHTHTPPHAQPHAHPVSTANLAAPRPDRLTTPLHPPNARAAPQPPPPPSPLSPAIRASATETTRTVAPEPVKPGEAKSVVFDLQPQEFEFRVESPEVVRDERAGDDEREREHSARRNDNVRERERDRDRERGRDRDTHKHGHRRRKRDGSPDSVASDETIELPPRFDQFGRARDEDPLAKGLENVLNGLLR